MATLNHTFPFDRFVALGDSITAGYADGALRYSSQAVSYPALIAGQCQQLKPFDFRQPFVDPDAPGISFDGRSALKLVTDKAYPENKWGTLSYAEEEYTLSRHENKHQLRGPFHNLAVPGAKVAHLLMPGYGDAQKGAGNYNPFFARMAADPTRSSVLEDALRIAPGFFTLFIGNNDILGYAMTGGTADAITPVEGPVGVGFAESLGFLVSALTKHGAQGIVAGLPSLEAIPYFNTICYNDLVLSKQEAEDLNARYARQEITFRTGINCFVIEDPLNEALHLRQLQAGEVILSEIMLDPLRRSYLSGQLPIPARYYLSLSDLKMIRETIRGYNDTIAAVARHYHLGLMDTGKLLLHAKPDRCYDVRARAIRYFETGAFSLDGIHINPMGQALLANEFIKCIRRHNGLKIPRLPIVSYRKKYHAGMPIKSYF